jgi:hypothetical protein
MPIREGLSGAAAIPALDLTDDEAFALAEQRRQALHYPLALRTKQMVPTVVVVAGFLRRFSPRNDNDLRCHCERSEAISP